MRGRGGEATALTRPLLHRQPPARGEPGGRGADVASRIEASDGETGSAEQRHERGRPSRRQSGRSGESPRVRRAARRRLNGRRLSGHRAGGRAVEPGAATEAEPTETEPLTGMARTVWQQSKADGRARRRRETAGGTNGRSNAKRGWRGVPTTDSTRSGPRQGRAPGDRSPAASAARSLFGGGAPDNDGGEQRRGRGDPAAAPRTDDGSTVEQRAGPWIGRTPTSLLGGGPTRQRVGRAERSGQRRRSRASEEAARGISTPEQRHRARERPEGAPERVEAPPPKRSKRSPRGM
jgi:hypothetical protein